MPNQPKTPISNFRFGDETRAQLAALADAYGTTMTNALKKGIEAMTALNLKITEGNSHYPFEAYSAGILAFRERMGYEPGQILPDDAVNAVDQAIIAANPIIREAQHYETLRNVVVRLHGMGADPAVVQHFRTLLPDGA